MLIEAMSAGVAVVATDVPGICDVVQDQVNGLLVPVGRPDLLRSAIMRVMNDASLRERLIENGLRIVRERFSWETAMRRYLDLLETT